MDALHPRLLVEDFEAAALFWEGALRDLLGIEPVKVIPQAGYAHGEVDGQTVLALFSRETMAQAVGTDTLPPRPAAQDPSMLVLRVPVVDDATPQLAAHGADIVAQPQDRPDWGAHLRTAHLRTPDGTLVELQSY
ncbi:VOC family protein [Streptomyces sp. NPDC018019]|uniref:VOC family protein n=1 Tax=Streptomyces sp. NPDC018019 TaxID=3365030 RepID=UPI0037982E49